MGSEDLVVERRIGLFQSEEELGEWGFQDKEYNRQRQVKVNVERYSKEQAAGAESFADVQGTGPGKLYSNNQLKARRMLVVIRAR
jgi:hypothetical protein